MAEKAFVAPAASRDEAMRAGDEANDVLLQEARRVGASSVVLVLGPEHPHFPEEKWIRVIEQPVYQIAMPEVGCQKQSTTAHLSN